MATTINNLLITAGLEPGRLKTVKWGQPLDSTSIGIYIVSTCGQPDQNSNLYDQAPIDESILRFWLSKVPTLQIDNTPNPTLNELKKRLSGFWFPDENIVYIGQTESGGGLRSRVNQYYRTELGERKPHAGGHWIKTLNILNQLFVHYIDDKTPNTTEEKLLHAFVKQVSDKTKKNLFDPILPIPFANLELEKGNRKRHGISKSKLGD
ncbi:hypothetical protein MASR2M44_01790 [Bacteroidota bacterium]